MFSGRTGIVLVLYFWLLESRNTLAMLVRLHIFACLLLFMTWHALLSQGGKDPLLEFLMCIVEHLPTTSNIFPPSLMDMELSFLVSWDLSLSGTTPFHFEFLLRLLFFILFLLYSLFTFCCFFQLCLRSNVFNSLDRCGRSVFFREQLISSVVHFCGFS